MDETYRWNVPIHTTADLTWILLGWSELLMHLQRWWGLAIDEGL